MNFRGAFAFPAWVLLCCALHLASLESLPDSSNCTSEKGVTFSHVYKLDLPKASELKVVADSLPLGDKSVVLRADGGAGNSGDEQNVIFRHNIRVQTPKVDCESASGFRELLARFEKLEMEVKVIQESCSSSACCGTGAGALPADLSTLCGGHGTFLRESCGCRCNTGWEGEDCSRRSCPGDCGGHGRCVDGHCICDEPYTGEDCGEMCPDGCSRNAVCVGGICQCQDGFTGKDCSEKRCPSDCGDNGYCDGGECFCEEGLTGSDCSAILGVQNLRLLRSAQESLTVGWDQVMEVDYYLIRYYATGEESQAKQLRLTKDQLEYEIQGLIPGTRYYILLYHVRSGVSSEPGELQATTGMSLLGTIWVAEETENSLEVEWENPAVELDHYKLRYAALQGPETEVVVQKSLDPKTSYIIAGLSPSTDYQILVWAVKGELEGKASSTSGTTDIDSPVNLVVNQVTENTASLSWRKVLALIDRYMLSYTSMDGETQEVAVGKEKSSIIVTGLKPGMEYTFNILAEKGSKRSKRATTKAMTDIDSPVNLVVNQVTEDTASLSWTKVLALVDRYMLSYTSADGETQEVAVGKEKSSTIVTGLRPGMEYTFSVLAEKGSKRSKKATTKAVTDIDSPVNLVVNRVTEDTASLSWTKVLALIDRYMLSYTSADGETQEVAVGKEKSSTIVTSLRPGMEYTFNILAEKGSKRSKRATTKAATEIDPPKNLRASEVTQTSSVLTWTAPTALIDGYILTYEKPDGTSKEVKLGLSSRFALEGLSRGVKYTIYLVAFRKDRQSRKTTTTFTTVSLLFTHPSDCSQARQNRNTTSGIYTIYLSGDISKPMQVYCDMTTDGGGWIVFQRRDSGKVDFYKKWRNYVEGFGDPREEFWIGLDTLHVLTSKTPTQYVLRVDLRTANDSAYAVYDIFQVASSRDKYRLSVGSYRGTAGDAMTYHNGYKFTTLDKDNDVALSNCAMSHKGAFWYKNCHLANPNGHYGDNGHSQGVNWEPWMGHEFSIPFMEMKIRPHASSTVPILGRKKRSLAGKRQKAM